MTISHIGDPNYLVMSAETTDHSYYHFFREAGGDIAAMVIFLYFIFGPCHVRTPSTWFMAFVIALGYYAPYWVGMPFNDSLSAPHMRAELAHILQAALVLSGLLISRNAPQ
ncbi:MAG: hypothetical protein V7711_18265 [Pseudomonadales bacterium]